VRAGFKVCKAVSSEKLERFLSMGFVKVRVGLYNPLQPEKVIEVDAIANTGAIYSVVRRDLLEELGVKPLRRRRFKAFGGYVERDVGEVGMVLLGERRIVPVIFGEEGDAGVIGVTALEIFGLEVDVVRGVLKEAELLLL
jgi:predicted aspartyl protease